MTCRTQIIGSIPVGFTSVEVADFSSEQVEKFVENWFKAIGKSETKTKEHWEKINSAVANKLDLKELTVTPVLLSLICLVLQDKGEIPSDRTWLYKKGVKLLLSRWNDKKQIDGWEVGTEPLTTLLPLLLPLPLLSPAIASPNAPQALTLALARTLNRTLALDLSLAHNFALSRDLDRPRDLDPELKRKLLQLRRELPASHHWESFHQWWQTMGHSGLNNSVR